MNSIYKHETAIVDEGAVIGDGSKIWHFCHIRESAKLGKNVIVGKSSYIDVNVKIGNNVKIQNLVSIYSGVTIGDSVFIGPHVTFTNDLFPRVDGNWVILNTNIQNGVSLGANSTILCGIEIGEHALVAAGSVVISDVPKHGLVAGNPSKLKGYVCFCAKKILDKNVEQKLHKIKCPHCGKVNEIVVHE